MKSRVKRLLKGKQKANTESKFFENLDVNDVLLTTNEAALLLGMSANALRIRVHRGQIKSLKLGEQHRFRREDLVSSLSEEDEPCP